VAPTAGANLTCFVEQYFIQFTTGTELDTTAEQRPTHSPGILGQDTHRGVLPESPGSMHAPFAHAHGTSSCAEDPALMAATAAGSCLYAPFASTSMQRNVPTLLGVGSARQCDDLQRQYPDSPR